MTRIVRTPTRENELAIAFGESEGKPRTRTWRLDEYAGTARLTVPDSAGDRFTRLLGQFVTRRQAVNLILPCPLLNQISAQHWIEEMIDH